MFPDSYKRFAIIGDIHGELNSLLIVLKRLEEIGLTKEQIYFVGDLVDRGPNSKEVIDLCAKQKYKSILGNHDLYFRELLKFATRDHFNVHIDRGVGGLSTWLSYSKDISSDVEKNIENYINNVPLEHKEYINSLPFYKQIICNDQLYLITHAGISRSQWEFRELVGFSSPETIIIDILSTLDDDIRKNELEFNSITEDIIFVHKYVNQIKFIPKTIQIIGHIPLNDVSINIKDNSGIIFTDTGCGKGGKLSAVIIPDLKIITEG